MAEETETEKTVAETMVDELIKIRASLERLERIGISRDLMAIYINKKTRVSMRDIKAVLESQEDFVKSLDKPFFSNVEK